MQRNKFSTFIQDHDLVENIIHVSNFRQFDYQRARLAQSVERETLNLKVVGSTPTPLKNEKQQLPLVSLLSLNQDGIKNFIVTSNDGLKIYAEEVGDPQKPTIIFLHGYLGTRLVWEPQFTSKSLREKFHLVRWDERGCGASDSPNDITKYNNVDLYADDLNAVIEKATRGNQKKKVILVGWSRGNLVAFLYLKKYGQQKLAGFIFVAATIDLGEIVPVINEIVPNTYSADLVTAVNATSKFINLFPAKPLDPRVKAFFLGGAITSPPTNREGSLTSIFKYGDNDGYVNIFRNITTPILAIFGADDRLVNTPVSSAKVLATNSRATLIIYPKAGHLLFWDVYEDFNRDIGKFVKKIFGKGN
ncbi:hypothetical protein G9A89_015293 [Geosiphon pyriformis]|nr:hypothetical protein G9A89_015293 [Geosiphon pyriformis]